MSYRAIHPTDCTMAQALASGRLLEDAYRLLAAQSAEESPTRLVTGRGQGACLECGAPLPVHLEFLRGDDEPLRLFQVALGGESCPACGAGLSPETVAYRGLTLGYPYLPATAFDPRLSAPPSEAMILLRALLAQPAATLERLLRVLLLWQQAPARRRALVVKLLDDQLTNKEVAFLTGVSERQLSRYPEVRYYTRLQHQRQAPPRGRITDEGELEIEDMDY
jgi:hypothetical protein